MLPETLENKHLKCCNFIRIFTALPLAVPSYNNQVHRVGLYPNISLIGIEAGGVVKEGGGVQRKHQEKEGRGQPADPKGTTARSLRPVTRSHLVARGPPMIGCRAGVISTLRLLLQPSLRATNQ